MIAIQFVPRITSTALPRQQSRRGKSLRVTSCLIAASFPAQARDRYLIHPVRGAVFSADSSRLITHGGPVAWLWDVDRAAPLRSFRHEKEILAATFNADATQILSHGRDGSVSPLGQRADRAIGHLPSRRRGFRSQVYRR